MVSFSDELAVHSCPLLRMESSVFQSGDREWLPGVAAKQTDVAWDKIRDHSSERL